MQDLEKLDQDKQRLLMEGVAPRAISGYLSTSVADPDSDPQDPYVLVLLDPDPESIRTRYGSFYNQAKLARRTLIPTVL